MIEYIISSFKISFKKFLIYRATSTLIVIFTTFFLIAEAVGILVIYQYTESIAGYNKNMMLLLLAVATLISTIYQFIFIEQHENLGDLIIDGDLDYLLLKPVNSIVLASVKFFDIPSLVNLIIPIGMIGYLLKAETKSLGFKNIMIFTLIVILGVVQYYCINQIIVSLSFIFEKTEKLLGIPEYIMEFATNPKGIYPRYINIILQFIVPILLATNLPIEFVMGKANYKLLGYFIINTLVLVKMVTYAWNKGLLKYQSSSS